VELVYVAVAAAFGYLATIVHKYYEVRRSVAAEIDASLTDALDLALGDTITSNKEELNGLLAMLRRVEHQTTPLPESSRVPVYNQIHVVTELAYDLWNEDHMLGPWLLQLALHAAREVLTPLLYPPFLIPRRPGKPKSFPDLASFQIMRQRENGLDLNEALDWSKDHGGLGRREH
jgi:hypothetical protein